MQNFVKHFYELIKKGDIDGVLNEIRTKGIDAGSLQDESAFKQNPMFSVALIPDEK